MVSRSTKLLLNCRVGDSTMGPLFSVVASGTLPPGIPSVSSRGQACEDIASSNDSRGANLVAGGVRACALLLAACPAVRAESESAEYQVYPLKYKAAAEVEKILGDMLANSGPAVHLVADAKANQILLRGPEKAQQIARAHRLDRSTSRPGSTVGESGGDAADLRRGEGPTGRDGSTGFDWPTPGGTRFAWRPRPSRAACSFWPHPQSMRRFVPIRSSGSSGRRRAGRVITRDENSRS